MSIVCGTDFSLQAFEAAATAARFGARVGLPVHLIHVIDSLDAEEVLREQPWRLTPVSEKLHQQAEHLRSLGASVKEVLLTGPTSQQLVGEAERVDARLLVLGAYGRGAGPQRELGSVPARVMAESSVPCLVVRGAGVLQDWASGDRPLKVMVGAGFDATSLAAIRWVGELRSLAPCDVILAHSYWPPGEHHRLGIPGTTSFAVSHPEIDRILIRELREKIGELPGQGEVRIHIEGSLGRTGARLASLAAQEEVDLLVLGSHQRHGLSRWWHGSISLDTARRASMSVACVPLSDQAAQSKEARGVRRILVPTDLSVLSNLALPFAASLLGGEGVICLLHVVDGPSGDDVTSATRERISRQLRAAGEHLGPEIQTEVVSAYETGEAICQAAERLGADLICMASHGRAGLSKRFAGSVAQTVMEKCRRPLLIVRPPREA